ncbi:MAG: peptide ABC transporter substrate-binding protein [Rhabdochlamydiaceae bacterium]|jgi:oligopeptide transport system substrate-binding protein
MKKTFLERPLHNSGKSLESCFFCRCLFSHLAYSLEYVFDIKTKIFDFFTSLKLRRGLSVYTTWVFLVLLLATGCQPQKGKQLKVNIGGEPQTLDPRKAKDLQSQTVVQMCFDGLTRMDPKDQPQLAVAERLEISSDGKMYTFHLRDCKWSNGERVTADDFAYAWKKSLSPSFPSDRAFQLYPIKNAELIKKGQLPVDDLGVQVLDAKTLQVELERPTHYFLELTALPIYFPIHQKTDELNSHWADEAATYICNGPFLPKEWKHSDCFEVVKNGHYWDAPHVQLDGIQLVMVSEDTEFKMYEKKELDWAGSPLSVLPLDAIAQLRQRKEFHTKPFLATYFFNTNTNKAPFNHPLMRKAFGLSINRQEIIDHVLQGKQIAATGLVPTAMGLQDAPYFKDGDVETAKRCFNQALKEQGLSLQDLPCIVLLYITSERNNLIAQAVQAQWTSTLGVDVKIEPMERKTFYDRLTKKDFQIAIGSWTADFNDPLNFLEIFKNKKVGSNHTSWENPKYEELLNQALSLSDFDARKKVLKESESLLIDEMAIIPLFHYTMLYLASERVRDVAVSTTGSVDFKWAFIVKDKK